MKVRLLVAAMSTVTVLLAGCGGSVPHPNCPAQQQAERKNAKDLDAFCYTEATKDTLKCQKAKDERNNLRDVRIRMESARWSDGGAIEYPYVPCAPVF